MIKRSKKIRFFTYSLFVLFALSIVLTLEQTFRSKTFAAATDCATDPSNPRFDGLLTTPVITSDKTKFPGNDSPCIVDPQGAPIDPTDLTKGFYTYDALKTQFFDKATKNGFDTQTFTGDKSFSDKDFKLNGNGKPDMMFYIQGN